MGGRESRGSLGCQGVARRVLWLSRGGRGGAVHSGEGPGRGRDPEAREGRGWGWGPGLCTVVVLFSRTVLEEPFTATERTSRRGAIRRPGRAVVGGGSRGSCPLVHLFNCDALEERSTVPEGVDTGLRPRDRDPAVGEGTAR